MLMLELVDEFCEDAAAAAANYLLFHTNIWLWLKGFFNSLQTIIECKSSEKTDNLS